MKVRILKSAMTSSGKVTVGRELDMQTDLAQDLIKAGYAEEIFEKKTSVPAETRENRKRKR